MNYIEQMTLNEQIQFIEFAIKVTKGRIAFLATQKTTLGAGTMQFSQVSEEIAELRNNRRKLGVRRLRLLMRKKVA